MEFPPVKMLCPMCKGEGEVINPDIYMINWAVEWLCAIQNAIKKERETWHPIQLLTKTPTVYESCDWLEPEEQWKWNQTNRYYVG